MDSKMKLEELFRRWKKETGRGFVSDGIVNHDVWQATSPKVIFLMKEPNDPNGTTPWDLCQFLCQFLCLPAVPNTRRRTLAIIELRELRPQRGRYSSAS